MAELITKLIESLNRYEFLTQIVAGVFLCFLSEKCAHVVVPLSCGFEKFVFCWLVGFISGRVGGLVVEPIVKRLGALHKYLGPQFVSRETYTKFRMSNEIWCKTLLTDANLYRTLFAGGILMAIARCVLAMQNNVTEWTNGDSVLVAWCILFYASYWRQVDMLRKNAEETIMSEQQRPVDTAAVPQQHEK